MSAQLVKELRERTNAPVGKCAAALKEADGDLDKAVEILKIKGEASAANAGGRETTEGRLVSYIHADKIAVTVEVNCQTDFVARSPEFIQFCNDLCLQIAATRPLFVSQADVPAEDLEKQRAIFEAQLKEQGKPEAAWPKILPGKTKSWFSEVCLSDQESVVHAKKTIEQLRVELVAKCGENVKIRRFLRWELGEGLAKVQKADFAAEIANLVNN